MSFWKKLFGVRDSPKVDVGDRQSTRLSATNREPPFTRVGAFNEAAISGDFAKAEALLREDPNLVNWKSDLTIGGVPVETLLTLAVKGGQKDIVQLLLTNKINVNTKDPYGNTPLHMAVDKGDVGIAELLLANKADVDAKNGQGWTPLFREVNKGNVNESMVKLLLANNADINAKTVEGSTPLKRALSGRNNAADLLLLAGKDSVPLESRLLAALKNVDFQTVEEILETPSSPTLNQALHVACESILVKAKAVSWLIKKGAEINCRGRFQRTPLHEAVGCGSEEQGDWDETRSGKDGPAEKVRLLTAHGADLTLREEHGLTPLAMAQYLGKHTAVALLSGTTVTAAWEQAHPIETSYETMSKQLVREHGPLEQLEYLSHYPNFEIKFYYQDGTYVYSGARTGKYDINFLSLGYIGEGPRYAMHFLKAAGFDLTTEEIAGIKEGDSIVLRNGRTVVNRGKCAEATKVNCTTPAPTLPEKPSVATSDQFVSFLMAIKEGDLEKITTLLKHNPDLVLCKDDNSLTALHYATHTGRMDIVKLLLANKADVNAKAVNGGTPLHVALGMGHKDVAELLRRRGGTR